MDRRRYLTSQVERDLERKMVFVAGPRQVRRSRAALRSALGALPSEDRRILRMRYHEGLAVRQIAAQLNLEARLLYKRIEKCLRRLRCAIEAQNLSREIILASTSEAE
jgi:DNA-directed RNA polymerase specialized sigma24 family protein